MGNETTCQKCNIKEEEEENEITAKEKPYDFKRIVYKLLNIIKQKKANTQQEKLFYGQIDIYEKGIKPQIKNTSTLTRKGGEEGYLNGNVKVIIPCPENQ